MSKLVALDLDGVLADDTHRQHYYQSGDYKGYFANEHLDDVFQEGLDLANAYAFAKTEFIYLTGRRSSSRANTEYWLDSYGFPMRRLIMREQEEWDVPVAAFKFGVLNYFALMGYDDIWLWDDDPVTIAAVQGLVGVTTRMPSWYTKPDFMIKKV